MTRLVGLCVAVCFVGSSLLISALPRFSRDSLAARLRPYLPGPPARVGLLSVATFREVMGPLARSFGNRASKLLGVSEDLSLRLERVHSPLSPTTFRMRQMGACSAAFCLSAVLVAALGLPLVAGLICILTPSALAFLFYEQRLSSASKLWQERALLELPLMEEQLAILLSAGYSLGSALSRLSRRSRGVLGPDLERVCNRLRQGLSEGEALSEWSAVAKVSAVDRLVALVSRHSVSTDLGRLVAEEARSTRQEVHRSLLSTLDKRAEQVWVPVTVATLVPGVIFLAIPFVAALRLFAGV